ncbi:MAG: aspartate aminotransferase family protein [Bacteroidota bacterium]
MKSNITTNQKVVEVDPHQDIYNRGKKVIPGGVSRNTIYRKPHPFYVAHAKGSYITDIDGTVRTDFANNMASLIHGHAHPEVVSAVTEQMQKGTAYTMGTEAEVAFAEHLNQRTPQFKKIRFMNSGTEAVMTMLKAARAYTEKSKIAKAEGAYHGTYDFAEISQTANSRNWGNIDKPNSVPLVYGTPKGVLDNVVIFPYNDIERTINILDQHADEIACVLIDPISHRIGMFEATNEYIKAIYNWTRKNNALMVFDEVITYRVNYSGAQKNYPVKPDMTALGKIIGGGFPIGAVAGKSIIMDVLNPRILFQKHPHSGTFSANPISMTAGKVTMELFDKQAVDDLNELTHVARKQIREVIKIADVPISMTGMGSMMRLHLQENAPTTYREINQSKNAKAVINKILDYMFIKENIIMINTLSTMFSTTLTQDDVDRLSDGLLRAFKLYKPKIEKLNHA